MKRLAITYYRVSDPKQGESGLSLAAQRASVHAFAKADGYRVEQEFTEVESGYNSRRPVLQRALEICARSNATLLIARLDRLARNVYFTAKLLKSKVEFIAIDNPHATKLIIHVMAAVAEEEHDLNSKRTKAALQVAKERGVVLGRYGRDVLSKLNHCNALAFAGRMKPLIADLKGQGISTVRALSDALNRLHVPTYRNREDLRWHPNSVHNLLKRIASLTS